MIRPVAITMLGLAIAFTPLAQAQPASGTTPAAAVEAPAANANAALQPFVASYAVLNGGKSMGEATMQVVRQLPQRWRVDLSMRGTGLFKLAGINAQQSTVFDTVGDTYRPLTQATVRKTVFSNKETTGIYDWADSSARWQGDVKDSRQRPLALQPGDMSGLLINLAVIRDAEPGKSLHYRFVDDGRMRDHHYVVAAEPETIEVGELSYSAMRVTRVEPPEAQARGEETLIWVASGVPTPIRMLQREGGEDTFDLRLIEYKGVQ